MAQLSDTTSKDSVLDDVQSNVKSGIINSALQVTLQAIHECVYGSTVRHVLKFPVEVLMQYLSTFPFYRGADTLYYLLLTKVGKDAYYTVDGRHLVTIQPELMGAYILAEQDLNAPIMKDTIEPTVHKQVSEYITRTITCRRYQERNQIILGEAPVPAAYHIPSIALNIPIYQQAFANNIASPQVRLLLIGLDCWEAIPQMDLTVFQMILDRIAFVRGTMPNLWQLVLREYFKQQLIRLRLEDLMPTIAVRQISLLNTLYPDLVNMPTDLDTLGIRIWFASRSARAYLLGIDLREGLPSDELVSERLHRLRDLGIEKYAAEITGIELDENKLLTGKIGILTYSELKGKRLLNNKDLAGIPLNSYYPHDMYPLVTGDNVVMITRRDMMKLIVGTDASYHQLRSLFTKENIPYIVETPSMETIQDMLNWAATKSAIKRGTPARVKLVETMAWDLIDY